MLKATREIIDLQIANGRRKYPEPRHPMTYILQWAGGLAWAVLHAPAHEVHYRAACLAALCVRLIEEGDPVHTEIRENDLLDALFNPRTETGEITPPRASHG